MASDGGHGTPNANEWTRSHPGCDHGPESRSRVGERIEVATYSLKHTLERMERDALDPDCRRRIEHLGGGKVAHH